MLAVVALLALNVGVGRVLDDCLIDEPSSLHEPIVLKRRIEAFPHPERVRVLVLGNSHALAGLTPPILADALGWPRDAVFSLALPGASPAEMAMLYALHGARFPHVETVVWGVDEMFLGASTPLRLRYLSRDRLDLRWNLAMTHSALDERISLVGTWFLPWADLAFPLKGRIKRALRAPGAETLQARLSRMPFACGYPPPWGHLAAPDEAGRAASRARWRIVMRARTFAAVLGDTAAGISEVERLSASLAARGVRPVLVDMPYTARFETAIRAMAPQAYERYRRRLLQARVAWVSRPAALRDDNFYDNDHLAPTGAAKLAGAVAARLSER